MRKEISSDGHIVSCDQGAAGQRVWHCDCAEFATRAALSTEGYCQHVALAIMQAIDRGTLEPEFSDLRHP